MDRDPPEDILRRFGQTTDHSPDALFEAALAFSLLDDPGRSRGFYRSFMRGLVNELRPHADSCTDAGARARLLADCLARRHGFTGDRDTYDRLENADIMSVIDRRRGLPVTLGILYIDLARALGWPAAGLNFPAHFLVRLDGVNSRAIFDPFHDGTELDPAALRQLLKSMTGDSAELKPLHYAPASDRDLLLRLQSNIRVRRLRSGDFAGAVTVLQRMLMIAPDMAELWYDLGILEIHRGDQRAGRIALEQGLACLDRVSGFPELRDRILKSLRELAATME